MANTPIIVALSDSAGKAILSVPTLATDQTIVLPSTAGTLTTNEAFSILGNYANDSAAESGGVLVGGLYRNGSILMVRVA